MTSSDDRDGLAPVTDLFGARSRRGGARRDAVQGSGDAPEPGAVSEPGSASGSGAASGPGAGSGPRAASWSETDAARVTGVAPERDGGTDHRSTWWDDGPASLDGPADQAGAADQYGPADLDGPADVDGLADDDRSVDQDGPADDDGPVQDGPADQDGPVDHDGDAPDRLSAGRAAGAGTGDDAGAANGSRAEALGIVSQLPARGPRRRTEDDEAAEWRSPVVGDGTGQGARAEQAGYDHAAEAEAPTASVFSIAGGDEIDPADAPRPLDEQRADAERISMRALGRRGVSTHEMRQALTKHELDADVVEQEIERLTRVGLLDDVALATDMVDRLHERKGLGRQGVVAELRRRGLDQVVIDTALEAAADDADDEFVRAIELATKRAGQMRGLDRETAERRLAGFLMRKGYGSGVVRIAVERALDGGGRRPGPGRGSVRFE